MVEAKFVPIFAKKSFNVFAIFFRIGYLFPLSTIYVGNLLRFLLLPNVSFIVCHVFFILFL